jgi:hypothetical protein
MGIETLFNYRPTKDLLRYLSSQNMADQTVAIHTSGSSPLMKWTGTAQAVVAGTFVASLAAQTSIDMSDAAIAMPITNFPGEDVALAGKVVADNGRFYLLFTTEADGTPHIYWAHDDLVAEDAGAPTLKIPYYSPDELTIALLLWSNDALTGDLTIGSSNLDTADDTFYVLTGPSLLPDIENIDRN